MNKLPHKHRRIAYGATLAQYIREFACPICHPSPWRVFLAALLRSLADRIYPGGAT